MTPSSLVPWFTSAPGSTLIQGTLADKIQGYEADNTNIKLLRLRSFTIGRPITDEDLNNEAQEKIISLIEIMEPFVSIARFSPLS